MGEVKSVKVDNWGVFFLQKLQNFFNKTDYCDLTLQFRDNSQLKVHRLVLSACTDYFNVLEQTCEIVDDALIMPNEFQADVVVPIVNFMYTGTLEFELKMYGKLLRTAKEMNMTVLLKLLEAHRRTMENVNRQQRPPSPKGIRRRVVGQTNSGTPQQRVMGTSPQGRGMTNVGTTPLRPNTQRGPIGNSMIRSVNTIVKQETSPFEQLRKGYNNNKRPAQTSLLSPPSKKPSLEEVKEFAEQQRMRKQIAAEFGDHDPEYDSGMLYDDVHAGDDDDDDMPPQPSTSKQQQLTASPQGTQTQLEHGSTTIILKQDSPSQTPTIIVKDSSNAKLNHTKIIAEVLRQYPHIVKGHKNIKLKIMPNTPATPAEKSPAQVKRGSPVQTGSNPPSSSTSPHKKLHVSFKADKTTPLITAQQKAASSQQKTNTNTQSSGGSQAAAPNQAGNAGSQQKRRIDSKTMHALIAQGAENTTGPWLCLRCGVNGRPISIPSYRGFRRHLINTHKETIDPALCEHCGWRSSNNRELHFHMYTEHQVKSLLYTFAECALCNQSYLTKSELEAHINEAHTDDNKQQCIYCNKVFEQELQLYRHMKSYHKEQALEDGIIDETDEEFLGSQDEEDEGEEEQEPEQTGKVRILSDISLPPTTSAIAVQQAADQQQLQEQLEQEQDQVQQQEVKFVGADGNEVELTDEQRKEILSQLNQQQAGAAAGGVVMVLSEPEAETAKQETDAKSMAGTEEEYDDSQIYSELAAADSVESSKKSVADESKESMDNLEWAENLIAESEEQSNKEPKSEKSRDDISEKLKELTGDWTEDENDEEADNNRPATAELEGELAAKQSEPTTGGQIHEDEEDDIDLALKSLHKGPEDSSATKTNEEAGDEAVDSAAGINSQPEQMEVDVQETKKDKSPESAVVRIKKEAELDAEEEEFIKEDPTTVDPEPEAEVAEAESSEAAAATEGEVDVHMEAENIRKELLEELIAESEKPHQEEEDEEKNEAHSEQTATTEVSAPTARATKEEDHEPAADHPAESEEPKHQKKVAKNEEGSKASDKKEIVEDKPNKCDEVASTDKAALVSTTVAETEGAASAAGGASEAEKVKSLISEWGDDEEEEDENGVSAAAKEEL
ncbi:centrosome-associated zinc finger protein Cp190 [Drosophila kikkawai]|uniref:Centrosome-associated zinc finger protein CP190 n=1 Tax=Drosophila kikkawai TaxID=30033 RepID=A0A6P4J2Z4_DROKI|nr:centrosome-associated zinc finger protein CP190 [Drosophila kikkawai]XP_017035747.1 centrosome-associated zinc finger protein CP190 [Drosophila kikkawai]